MMSEKSGGWSGEATVSVKGMTCCVFVRAAAVTEMVAIEVPAARSTRLTVTMVDPLLVPGVGLRLS